MNWKEKYADKIVSLEEAMSHINYNDRVMPGCFGAEPCYLVQGLADAAPKIGKVRVIHAGNIGPEPHLQPGMEKWVDFTCLMAVPISRAAMDEKRADYLAQYFHQWPRLIRSEQMHINVGLIQLSEPNEDGICSFGVSADYGAYLPEVADITIAQINSEVPWIESNTTSLDNVDYLVIQDEPLVELKDSFPGEKEKKIAEYVLPLIQDGACLQIGRGKLPDYVMSQLMDRKDLSIHSEMISDGVMKLMEAGVVTNKYKKVHPGKTVCSMVCGSAELYKWVDHNSDVEVLPVDFTNDPFVIAQNDNVVSINSALQIDLQGQIVCDMIGPRQFTGVGGFTDFVRGSQASKGGKSIVAFASTANKGQVSRIVPYVSYGSCPAATRFDVNYVVTEYGAVQLWGKTVRERAKLLISIAHPDFREELTKQAYEMGLLW